MTGMGSTFGFCLGLSGENKALSLLQHVPSSTNFVPNCFISISFGILGQEESGLVGLDKGDWNCFLNLVGKSVRE